MEINVQKRIFSLYNLTLAGNNHLSKIVYKLLGGELRTKSITSKTLSKKS